MLYSAGRQSVQPREARAGAMYEIHEHHVLREGCWKRQGWQCLLWTVHTVVFVIAVPCARSRASCA